MKIFVWTCVTHLTNNWHNGGGLVVVADSLDAAREMIKKKCPDECDALVENPSRTYEGISDEPNIFIFPDAGCC